MKFGKKTCIVILLALFIISPMIITPKPAQAFSPDVVAVTVAKWTWERVKEVYKASKEAISGQLAKNALNMYMQKLSYDLATELATGGPGGKPQFRIKSIGDASQDALEAAGGEFLGELTSKGFDDLGINLCAPTTPEIKLTLSLALIDQEAPPKPKCNWNEVKKNWGEFGDNIGNNLIKFQLDTRTGPGNTQDFFKGLTEGSVGTYLKLTATLNDRKREEIRTQDLETAECRGYKDKATTITQEVKIHCNKIFELSNDEFRFAVEAETATKASAADAKSSSISFGQIMKDAGQNFMDTLSSKLLKQWIKKGTWSLFGNDDNLDNTRESLIAQLRGGANIRQPRGQDIFRDFTTITINRVEEYNVLEDFVVCPQETDFRKPDNCVISSDFLEAINTKLTLRKTIEQGLISGNLPLISKDDVFRNNSDSCYKEGLCYSNLVKLRKTNIIPVGWELAALRSSITSPVTIQQAIDCFEDTNCAFAVDDDYAVDGVAHNPFYHLIDGNWVLKMPKALCEASVYAPILESPETSSRQQYCADLKTCLREDDQGNCLEGQYGYCTRSENIWRFDGDICEDGEIYSGCLTFNHEEYGDFSYIQGSLDYCTADQAGCRRYSQEKDNDGNWSFADVTIDDQDIFLNSQAKDCSADEAGCSEYIVLAANRGINVVPNGSFADNDGDGIPDYWSSDGYTDPAGVDPGYNGDYVPNGYSGSGGIPGTELVAQNIPLLKNTFYSLSVSAAQYNFNADSQARIIVSLCDQAGGCVEQNNLSINTANPVGGLAGGLTDCFIAEDNSYGFPGTNWASNADLRFTPPASGEWVRESCTFLTDDDVVSAQIRVLANNSATTAEELIYFDDIELEVIDGPTVGASPYSDYGVGGTINIGQGKIMCVAEEVGCQGYYPDNNDPMIPAVINQEDLCPAECVGYATFSEEPTLFDEMEGDTDFKYYNFIADTATFCPNQEIGCEEFTNLDAVAQGGEGREYYTYLRQCVLATEGVTYYTWEGSDVAGYQIKTWLALESNLDNAPCTNIEPGTNTCIDGAVNYATAICDPALNDPNCREFFDLDGNLYYRLQDKIIFASDDCHDYRRTISGEMYKVIPNLSLACSEANNNCRSYYGNAANNVRVVFSNSFESGTYSPWTNADGSTNNIDLSSESLNNNGHSIKVTNLMPISRAISTMQNNKEYELSWWMKNDSYLDNIILLLKTTDNDGNVASFPFVPFGGSEISNIEGGNWHQYTITSLVDFGNNVDLEGKTVDLIIIFSSGIQDNIFLDNITLKEVNANVAVIKNSWNTPAACDSPYVGYHLGCQAYTDTNQKEYNLKSFNRLCREAAIGCTPVIDTHNSNNPLAETFNNDNYSEITVPADSINYLVPDITKYCNPSYQGCMALGLPDRENELESSTVYKINDPDQYSRILCNYEGLYCEEYDSAKGLAYFKDPGSQTCTYQENVNLDDTLYNGWFRTDSLDTTSPIGCSNTGGAFDPSDLELASDWAGTCPATKNLCTTFIDPADPAGCDPTVEGSCKAYYYYDNDKIDESSCAGQVDRNGACALFYETNHWNADHSEIVTYYDSGQTYEINVSENRAVSPVICDPSFDPNCHLDSNRLIKVVSDRQCAEWLACKSSTAVWDENANGYKTICDGLNTCIEYDDTNNITKCKKWASYNDTVQPLTTELYQSRTSGDNNHLQWSDKEYLGYSIPNLLPVQELISYVFNTDHGVDSRVVYDVYNTVDPFNNRNTFCLNADNCCVNASNQNVDGGACQATINNLPFIGECHSGLCWVSPLVNDLATSTFSLATRGYAVSSAPFPEGIEVKDDRIQAYSGANICETDSDTTNGCEISYKKVTYGLSGGSKYYPVTYDEPEGICINGDSEKVKNGTSCTNNYECNSPNQSDPNDTTKVVVINDGSCALKTAVETFANWPGICLEYDYSTPLVSDGKKSFVCNQWYPANKINGANSLFDNYREAGFYNPDGQDILFCSVAEDYELPKDRIYCGRSTKINGLTVCDLLLRVPAGAKIKINAINITNSFVITSGYLKTQDPEIFTLVAGDEIPSIASQAGSQHYDDGIGYDRIERSMEKKENFGYFEAKDFVSDNINYIDSDLMIVTDTELAKFFTGPIYKYYHDKNHPSIKTPEGRIIKKTGICGSPPAWERISCEPYEHLIYGKTWRSDSHCKLGGARKNNVKKYCNPLDYHYYVNVEKENIDVVCEDTNCSNSLTPPYKGAMCMFNPALAPTVTNMYNNPTYTGVGKYGYCGDYVTSRTMCATSADCTATTTTCLTYPWPGGIYNLTNEDQCGTNPNCKFLYCVFREVITPDMPVHPDDFNPDGTPVALPGPTWCSDYGSFDQIFREEDDEDNAYYETTRINGCFTKIYGIYDSSDLETPQHKEAGYVEGVDPGFIYELFGDGEDIEGCLISTIEADCINVPNPVTGILGAECVGLECYQMCSTIVELDSEANNSWVRTDIWWRNEETNQRVISPAWRSWYYSSSELRYVWNANVTFSEVKNEGYKIPYGYFGAAIGSAGTEPVVNQAPLGVTPSSGLSTITFFNNDYALANLFARVYNRIWDDVSGYGVGIGASIEGSIADPNPRAGNDYRPRILQVCEETTCEIDNVTQSGITINNRNNEDIVGHESLFIATKFFYYAHPDHMPVMSIAVDWDEDNAGFVSSPGKYKNNIPNCDPDLYMPGSSNSLQGFGGLDRACHMGYKIFYHNYQYDSTGVYACGRNGSDPIPNASCYQPSVQVVDRWGETTTETFDYWVVIYEN